MRLVNCLRIGSFVNRWYLCSNWLCSLRYEWPARITLDEMALALALVVVILSGRLLCVAASQQRVVKLVGGDTLGPPLLPAFLICYDFNQIWKFSKWTCEREVLLVSAVAIPTPEESCVFNARLGISFLPPQRERLRLRLRPLCTYWKWHKLIYTT